MNIEHKKTVEILKWFEEINKIPRCSKKEKQIGQWLMDWAKTYNFAASKDNAGNVVIKVTGSAGYENAVPVIIQGHQDMVCEKTPDSPHDFEKDPIRLVYDGEWLKADKTTLGADNGIAIAMGLAAALDKKLKHPPLELLFTVDEETGLTGAFALEPGFVQGRLLLNIDS
jgi:dipeptidase D